MHDETEHQSECVDDDVPLAFLDLSPGIMAANTAVFQQS